MADFSNFELATMRQGRGVAELADGLIPEIAQVFGVELSERPTVDELGVLVGAVGKSKVLQENLPQVQEVLGTGEDALGIMSEWVIRSGVQHPLDRSLWTPNKATPKDIDAIVLTGAVANWQDRMVDLLTWRRQAGHSAPMVYMALGNKVMDSATEVTNPNVQAFVEEYGTHPTQAQYGYEVIMPKLLKAGYGVVVDGHETDNGSEIAAAFVDKYNWALSGKLAFARVANAGIQLAGQFRKAARQHDPAFDADPTNPQVFVLTDTFPVAQDEEENKQPAKFQRPATGIGMIARTAKTVAEAAA